MPSFDEALLRAGEFGRFQRRVFLLLCLTGVTFAFLFVGVVFLGSQPDHYWCRGPSAAALAERCGWSPEEEWNRTAPALRGPAPSERRGDGSCQRYLLEAANASAAAGALSCADPLAAFPNRSAPLVPCRGGWRYAQAHSTIISEVRAHPRRCPPGAAATEPGPRVSAGRACRPRGASGSDDAPGSRDSAGVKSWPGGIGWLPWGTNTFLPHVEVLRRQARKSFPPASELRRDAWISGVKGNAPRSESQSSHTPARQTKRSASDVRTVLVLTQDWRLWVSSWQGTSVSGASDLARSGWVLSLQGAKERGNV